MFAEPPPTRYDLTFRVFGVPVRVHPLFWLVTILLSGSRLGSPPELLFIWVGVVFVSILVHELGHVAAFRWCGVRAHVVLYGFGGLAVPWAVVDGRWRRVAVAVAGPAAGFALAGLVWGSNELAPWVGPDNLPLVYLYFSLLWVNVAWGLVNLLPVVPLDGGRVSEEVCTAAFGGGGRRVALWVSVAVAGLVAVYSVAWQANPDQMAEWLGWLPWWVPRGGLFTALMFGYLAYLSYQAVQQLRWTESHWDDNRDW